MRAAVLTMCAVLMTGTSSHVQADSPTTEPVSALAVSDLSGSWNGERDGVTATVEFHDKDACGNDVTWHLHNNKALISADLKLVDEPKSGTVGLVFNFKKSPTGQRFSVIVGRLERTTDGKVYLTVLPAAEDVDHDYVKASHIELRPGTVR